MLDDTGDALIASLELINILLSHKSTLLVCTFILIFHLLQKIKYKNLDFWDSLLMFIQNICLIILITQNYIMVFLKTKNKKIQWRYKLSSVDVFIMISSVFFVLFFPS